MRTTLYQLLKNTKNIWYQYTYLPNGLSSASRIFTKLLKPVYASLHTVGHLSLGYIDDSYLQGDSAKECSNIKATAILFNHLGFHLHPTKSVIITTQTLKFLGFRLDSLSMTVSPTRKIIKTVEACQRLQKWPSLKSQRLQQLLASQCLTFLMSNLGLYTPLSGEGQNPCPDNT